jgi:hypothetical protein
MKKRVKRNFASLLLGIDIDLGLFVKTELELD